VFGDHVVLDGIDLDVARGEIVALTGRNGAGKSTLLRIVATTLLPSGGSGSILGHDLLLEAESIRAACGSTLGDERGWYWRLTGRENLEFFAALVGLGPKSARERACRVLALAGLEDAADKPFGEYSTGMRLRMSVGRALLSRPGLLLLDEPTRSLDLQASRRLHELIATLVREEGVSILMATHDLYEATVIADRVIVLAGGCVAADLVRPERGVLEATLGA
jgi:ABC-2 type transport system ATP-binding protein